MRILFDSYETIGDGPRCGFSVYRRLTTNWIYRVIYWPLNRFEIIRGRDWWKDGKRHGA